MKIHFFGSLIGNQIKIGDKTNYERIVEAIEFLGYEVITKHALTKQLKEVLEEDYEQHEKYYQKMIKWIREADIVIAEVTKPEIGTGYELALAVNSEKPVIALYTDGQNSPILLGHNSDRIQHLEYDINNIKQVLRLAINDAKNQSDVRFNFFVSPKIVSYLDWVAKKRKMPRAVYLRRLIEKDMEKNKEFEKED